MVAVDLKVSKLQTSQVAFDKAKIIRGPNSSNEDIIFHVVLFISS